VRELLGALFIYFISPVLWLLQIVIIVYVVLSWLIVGGVVQPYNPTTRQIMQFCGSIIEPMARPLRRVLPRIGNLDLSVFALILIIGFLQSYALPRLISLVPF
jgi:YggT family protein